MQNDATWVQPEGEDQLWVAYKKRGCEESRRSIILNYQPLVYSLVKGFSVPGHVRSDLIQEGTIGLLEAVAAYDPERAVLFSTFARYRIRGRILNYLGKESRSRKRNTSMPAELQMAAEDDPEREVERRVLFQRVRREMERLPGHERKVLEGRIIEDRPAGEVAASLAISTAHLYRLQKKGIRRLRGMLRRFLQENRLF